MERIGETLRNARLAKNISIEEIVKETKIRSRYIEALEEENWDIFPGTVYLRGFLKSYCNVLGLDDKEMLRALNQEVKVEAEAQPVAQKLELPGRPRKKVGVILGLIAIILLVCIQYFYQNFVNQPIPVAKEQPTVQTPMTENTQTSNPGGPDTATPTEPIAEPVFTSITLRLVGVDAKCWVRVKDGPKLVYEGTMSPGEEKIYSGLNGVTVTFGNAGIQSYLNDTDYGRLGSDDHVVTKSYTLENNEVKEVTN